MHQKKIENKNLDEVIPDDASKTGILILKEIVSGKEIYMIFRKEEKIGGIGYAWRYMGPRNFGFYGDATIQKMERLNLALCVKLSQLYNKNSLE